MDEANRSNAGPVIFAAGLLIPVSGPPIREGAVLVEDGRISAVGGVSELGRRSPHAEVRLFPRDTIIPGAVNAHAHLGFRREGRPEGGSFARWLSQLVEKMPEKRDWTAEAARDSAREAVEAGTTFMAESSPYGECLPQLAESGMAGRVYAEFFPQGDGEILPAGDADFVVEKAKSLNEGRSGRIEARVSVHALYSVDPDSARRAARMVRELGWQLAIHLSESPEENEYVRHGTGGLAEFFGTPGWADEGLSPVRFAEEIELLAPSTIAAHLATGVSDEDVEILARTGVAAAHCPRSNEYLGCGVSPVPRMMDRGVRVGIGTDGLWSSPSMNLFEEMLAAVRLHGLSGETGLRLATLEGARALGVAGETGSLEAGKWADLAVVEGVPDGGDAEREVVEAAAGDGVAATVVGGGLVYNRVES